MKDLSVKNKFRILFFIVLGVLVALTVSMVLIVSELKNKSLNTLSESIEAEYDNGIKQEVNTAIAICQYYSDEADNGLITKDDAMKYASNQIRDLRYSDTGYFWVDTYDGVNVVLLGSDTEGTNRLDTKDINGFAMVADFIEGAKNNVSEGYYSDYYFPKEGETEASKKRAYTKVFEPFNWVIGTGNYVDNIDTDVAEKGSEMDKFIHTVLITIFIIVVVLTIIIILYLLVFWKNIEMPLIDVEGWLSKMKDGDFSIRIRPDYVNRKDDFGNLMRSIEKMRQGIEKTLGIVQSTANQVGNSAFQLSESAADTKSTSEGITNAVEDIANGATNQAESIQDGVKAIQNILENVDELSSDVNIADEGAEKMAVSSDNMRENFHKLTEAMNKTKESLDDVSSKVQMMGDSVSDVVNAVGAINEISEQTNLLSLNASIEAARAGEAGKGFAVVATEIQKLSEQSAQSAQKIGDIMKVLSSNSEITVSTVEGLKTSVDDQQKISDETRQAARDVIEIIDETREIFTKAKEACKVTKDRCGDLNDTMSSLSAISEENAASSEETSASMTQVNDTVVQIEGYSTSLNDIAGELKKQISIFKVSNGQ